MSKARAQFKAPLRPGLNIRCGHAGCRDLAEFNIYDYRVRISDGMDQYRCNAHAAGDCAAPQTEARTA